LHARDGPRIGAAGAVVSDRGTSSYANMGLVTGGYFEVRGVQAQRGRRFTSADDREGAEPVAVGCTSHTESGAASSLSQLLSICGLRRRSRSCWDKVGTIECGLELIGVASGGAISSEK
jgi:hypothetical protein